VLPSIAVGYAVTMKESYDMKLLLNCVNYKKYQWQLCGDLKVTGVLLGLQQGYTKFCCFLCEWDSRAKTSHYKRTITGTGNKECTAPTVGRIQQHFAASSALQTRTNEEFC
jgi:hypothetical protein